MSGEEKLINKILDRKNVTVDDCVKILVYFGYEYHEQAAVTGFTTVKGRNR